MKRLTQRLFEKDIDHIKLNMQLKEIVDVLNLIGLQNIGGNRKVIDDEDYSCVKQDFLISVENLTASRTISLPYISALIDTKLLYIKDTDGNCNTHNIIIDTPDSAKIDGSDTYTMDTNYESLLLAKNGDNWSIV